MKWRDPLSVPPVEDFPDLFSMIYEPQEVVQQSLQRLLPSEVFNLPCEEQMMSLLRVLKARSDCVLKERGEPESERGTKAHLAARQERFGVQRDPLADRLTDREESLFGENLQKGAVFLSTLFTTINKCMKFVLNPLECTGYLG